MDHADATTPGGTAPVTHLSVPLAQVVASGALRFGAGPEGPPEADDGARPEAA
jgi:hypothetical protein